MILTFTLSLMNRPYAYDVTEGRPRVLGVKRGTATCAIAKHAASGPTGPCMPYRRASPRPRTDWESASTTRARSAKSWPPTWRRCYGDVMHKVYSGQRWAETSGMISIVGLAPLSWYTPLSGVHLWNLYIVLVFDQNLKANLINNDNLWNNEPTFCSKSTPNRIVHHSDISAV